MSIISEIRIGVTQNNPVPIYRQVKEALAGYIIKNRLPEGTPLPDVKTIASLAGVSLKTGDRALNELISEGICFRRPKKGTFVGKGHNRFPKRTLGGLYSSGGENAFEDDQVQAVIHRGILKQMGKKRATTFFISSRAEEDILFYAHDTRVNFTGIIMLGWTELTETLSLARKFPHLKFIFLDNYVSGFEDTPPNVYGVFNDDFAGGYQMTEYLINKGHKRIAVFSFELKTEDYRLRVQGYRQALRNHGIPPEENLVYSVTKPINTFKDLKELGRTLAQDLLGRVKPPTAIFCVNDTMASGVIDYLKTKPEDRTIEVCGYDNVLPDVSKDYNFSTVALDFEQMGIKAIDILTAKSGSYPKVIKILPRILIRRSRYRD